MHCIWVLSSATFLLHTICSRFLRKKAYGVLRIASSPHSPIGHLRACLSLDNSSRGGFLYLVIGSSTTHSQEISAFYLHLLSLKLSDGWYASNPSVQCYTAPMWNGYRRTDASFMPVINVFYLHLLGLNLSGDSQAVRVRYASNPLV